MSRKKIVAGNWKMNLLRDEAHALISSIQIKSNDIRVIAFPPSLYLSELKQLDSPIELGAQNISSQDSGALTGEISAAQVKSCGISLTLIGHSERRIIFGESHELLREKVDAAVRNGMEFIFCCGEPLAIRESGEEKDFVIKQLQDSLFHLDADALTGGMIAYEPVWAIGTGKTATAGQAEEMHLAIRNALSARYSVELAASVSILYGGSCNENNAKELFACSNVDGGLIGGASLKKDTFEAIINSF